MGCIADTVEVQRWRGLSANLRSPYGRSKRINRRWYTGRSGRSESLIGGERLLSRRAGIGVDPRQGWRGLSPTIGCTAVPSFSWPIPNGGWFLALQLPQLYVQVVAGFRRQLGLHVFRVQGLDPDGWFGCLSWSGKCRIDYWRGILHCSEMKAFVSPLWGLMRQLKNPIKGRCRLNGVIEW